MTTAPSHLLHPASHRHVVEGLLIALLAVFAGALVLAAGLGDSTSTSRTITGSGRIVSQARALPEFGALDLGGTNNVTVRVGPVQRVVVRADDNLVGHVTTVVRRGELVIGETGSFRTSGTMQVDVTVPTLNAVALSGTGSLAVDGIRSDRFAATLTGTGVLRASGSVDWLQARLSGDGELQLGDLRARHASARMGGTGRIVVNARTLEQSVTGTGTIVRR